MKLSRRQLKRIIREAIGTEEEITRDLDRIALDHVINCYVNGMHHEKCADDMPNKARIGELQDFGNFILRVVNKYRDLGNF